jgi:hypothetical protein
VYGYAKASPLRLVDPDGRQAIPLPQVIVAGACIAGAMWLYNKIFGDEPENYGLKACIDASNSKQKWTAFCTASPMFTPMSPTRNARCHDLTQESPTRKRGFCYNEFGK